MCVLILSTNLPETIFVPTNVQTVRLKISTETHTGLNIRYLSFSLFLPKFNDRNILLFFYFKTLGAKHPDTGNLFFLFQL